ncbi:hypothetical protein FDZ84_13390 [Saccharopolyspora sp. ASAGF58]|nr:hypothetical protein FDZ84_13390 [Saccharopolyspora sp. ASAGF58]
MDIVRRHASSMGTARRLTPGASDPGDRSDPVAIPAGGCSKSQESRSFRAISKRGVAMGVNRRGSLVSIALRGFALGSGMVVGTNGV